MDVEELRQRLREWGDRHAAMAGRPKSPGHFEELARLLEVWLDMKEQQWRRDTIRLLVKVAVLVVVGALYVLWSL